MREHSSSIFAENPNLSSKLSSGTTNEVSSAISAFTQSQRIAPELSKASIFAYSNPLESMCSFRQLAMVHRQLPDTDCYLRPWFQRCSYILASKGCQKSRALAVFFLEVSIYQRRRSLSGNVCGVATTRRCIHRHASRWIQRRPCL
jgi:hypothetical protein